MTLANGECSGSTTMATKEDGKNERTVSKGRCDDGATVGGDGGRFGTCAKTRWSIADLSPRQPGEHVDPRGGNQLGRDSNDGGVQQPRALRSAQGPEQPRYNRSRLGRELVVERGRDPVNLQTTR